jgi:hypothetical protein
MPAPDACAAFLKALHEDKDRITDIVFEKMQESPSFVLNRIPDGGMTNFNDQLDNIEYRAAKQAFRQYDELNDDPRALVSGDMKGVDCAGVTVPFTTKVNADDPSSSCHDEGLLDFGQGYRIRKSKMFRLAITTPVICAFDFIRMGPAHVDGFFSGMTEAFTDYGMENFEANLQNYVIQYGEANASVNSVNEIVLTTGGFNAPPLYRLSIPFLRRYRQYMIREGGLTDDGLLEIETTRQDAIDAILADQAQLGVAGFTVNEQIFADTRGQYYSKSGVVYNGIKFIFNELPVRGYFMPSSITAGGEQLYTFVRVYHWQNEVNEAGGLSWQPNHDYDKSTIVCNGVTYKMSSLAFVINAKSFQRFGLGKPNRIKGQNAGTNFEMIVLDGSFITCNDFNDKFRLAARHMFRFKSLKPQLSGAIAYRHAVPDDYVIEPDLGVVQIPPQSFAGPQEFGPSGVSPCCPGAVAVADPINVSPVGGALVNGVNTPDVKVVWGADGTGPVNLKFTVTRKGDGNGTLIVTPTVTPGTALLTTHYQNPQPSALNWADKEVGSKTFTIPIVGVVADADADGEATFTVALAKTGTTTDTLAPTESAITVSIYDGR